MKPSEVAARITEVEPFVCHWDDDEQYVATCGYCQAQGGGWGKDSPIVHEADCPWLLAQKTMPTLVTVVEAAVAWREKKRELQVKWGYVFTSEEEEAKVRVCMALEDALNAAIDAFKEVTDGL